MTRPPLAAAPTGPIEVPRAVASIARGDAIEAVWLNEAGGVTFRLTSVHGGVRFAKTSRISAGGGGLSAEAERLAWAAQYARVPEVLENGTDDEIEWLVTRGLRARSAVDERWLRHPEVAVRAMGRGLRALHEALPVDDCPFDWSVDERLARATAGATSEIAESMTAQQPPIDRLVVCHGDACAPNTLLTDAGEFAAHVDLGRLGVADRWADIAIGAWSTEWNFGAGWDGLFYKSYGVGPDLERIAFYRQLWDAT